MVMLFHFVSLAIFLQTFFWLWLYKAGQPTTSGQQYNDVHSWEPADPSEFEN